MNNFKSITKPLAWFMAMLMVAFVAGCGGSNSNTATTSSSSGITSYSLTGSTGLIDQSAKTIAVNKPFGTDVTSLAATFATTGASVNVGATAQVSGTTPNDFTLPVAYIVTAADSSTETYSVTVTVSSATAKAITSYSLAGAFGTISGAASPFDIAVTVPSGTSVTALKGTFTTTGASVKVGATVQVSGTTPNDFTSPVTYTVTANDASTADYVVTVIASASGNPIAPALGETGRFVVLASQTITTTGTTASAIVNGDMGILDQARTYYTGFTAGANPGQFDELTSGLSYAHSDTNPALIPAPYASTIAFINQVRTDLGIAYSFLATDPNPGAATQVCPTQLGGQTLTRGVYKTAVDVLLTTGPLHLDAQGDPNAVFIFTIDGTLTVGAPSGSIILDNNAQAKNVFFRTGGSTAIEAGTSFFGNVFAWSQVSVLSGANITGRLFAVTNQVTLISDNVTKAP